MTRSTRWRKREKRSRHTAKSRPNILAISAARTPNYVGNIKGVGRIYQQTFIDSYSKVVQIKLYDRKHAITAADMLNDRVLPWYEEQGIPVLRILTDRGSEYCGNREHHEFALYLDLEGIDHTRTKTKSPQTNGRRAGGKTGSW